MYLRIGILGLTLTISIDIGPDEPSYDCIIGGPDGFTDTDYV